MKLWRWTAFRWLRTFAGSSTCPNPLTRASQLPRTPSERQPVPYWYFGPSFSSIAAASVE